MANAIPTWVNAGAIASSTTTGTPGAPASPVTDDIWLLFVETANEAVTTPSGWTLVQAAQGTGVTSVGTMLNTYWLRYSGQSAPTIADPGDHIVSIIHAFRGCEIAGDPWNAVTGGVDTVSDAQLDTVALTTTVPNCLIVTAYTSSRDTGLDGTAEFGAPTNASLGSLTERSDNTRTAGNAGGIAVTTGTLATAGSSGSLVSTYAGSSVKAWHTIALIPRAGDTPGASLTVNQQAIQRSYYW